MEGAHVKDGWRQTVHRSIRFLLNEEKRKDTNVLEKMENINDSICLRFNIDKTITRTVLTCRCEQGHYRRTIGHIYFIYRKISRKIFRLVERKGKWTVRFNEELY